MYLILTYNLFIKKDIQSLLTFFCTDVFSDSVSFLL